MEKSVEAAGVVQHLDHFVLPVVDAERAERFYTEALGARFLYRRSDPTMTRIFMKVGQNHVGLFSQNKATIPKRNTLNSYPRGAFVVPGNEFEKVAARIRSMSSLVGPIENGRTSTGCGADKGIVFADSEENLVEVFQEESTATTKLHHLHFDTLDLDQSIRYYSEVLKLVLLESDDGVAVVGIPTHQSLVLHEVKELSVVTRTAYRGRHFAFHVKDDDFHVIVDRLHGAGIEEGDVLEEFRRPGQLGTYFKDPSGFRLQITNEDSASFAHHAATRPA